MAYRMPRRLLVWTLAMSLCGAWVGTLCLAQVGQNTVVYGLRIPLQYWPDGNVKTRLLAGEARMPEGAPVVAKDVRVEMLQPDGETVLTRIEAEDCTYNKSEGVAESSSRVRVARGDVTIEGVGFKWSAEDQSVSILRDVKVTIVTPAGSGAQGRGLLGTFRTGKERERRRPPRDDGSTSETGN